MIADARGCGEFHLHDLDLSDCELSNISFEKFRLENIVFSRHDPCDRERKQLFNVSFENATLNHVSFAHADLKQCNFDGSLLLNADFFYSKLSVCRFREAKVGLADFRYTKINDSSLSKCEFKECDFYMCGFYGLTTLHDTSLTACSITDAVFEYNIIRIRDIRSLLQENYDTYSYVISRTSDRINNPVKPKGKKDDPSVNEQNKKEEKEIQIAAESSDAYLALSGIYQGKGFMEDSNKAYKRANDCRLKHYLLRIKYRKISWGTANDILQVMKYAGIAMMGYGYQWWKVCLIFLVIALVGGAYMHYCVPDMDIVEAYARGLNNSMGPQDSFAERVGNFLYSSTHSALGLLVIGFLGFILANKVRNNS
jgi:hypothetical protein